MRGQPTALEGGHRQTVMRTRMTLAPKQARRTVPRAPGNPAVLVAVPPEHSPALLRHDHHAELALLLLRHGEVLAARNGGAQGCAPHAHIIRTHIWNPTTTVGRKNWDKAVTFHRNTRRVNFESAFWGPFHRSRHTFLESDLERRQLAARLKPHQWH